MKGLSTIRSTALNRGLSGTHLRGFAFPRWFVIAAAEIRSASRKVRFWTFACVMAGVSVFLFGFYGFLPASDAAPYLPVAYSTPRFLIWQFGSYLMWLSLVGVTLLMYDATHRDTHERMADVIDSRPLTNMALFGGRLMGVVSLVAVTAAIIVLLVQLHGFVSDWVGWPWSGIEELSAISFLVFDMVPTLAFWGATVLVISSVLRNRLAVALVALVLLALCTWVAHVLPVYLHSAIIPLSDHAGFASDLAPRFVGYGTLLHRLSVFSLATGLTAVAAALDRRVDSVHCLRMTAIGIAFTALGGVGVTFSVMRASLDVGTRDNWLGAHEPMADMRDIVRVERVDGHVVIDPGVRLLIDVELSLVAVAEESTLLFSLNPGLELYDLQIEGLASYRHQRGLLVVDLKDPMTPGIRRTLAISAAGIPDPRFAYLDGTVDPLRVRRTNRVWRLGREASLFHRRYVALMPAIRWLPTAGPNLGSGGSSRSSFEVDLTVDVPSDWFVAGPGRRWSVDVDETTQRFRFSPGGPVSSVALFASRFDRHELEVGSIHLEILAMSEHMDRLERLSGSAVELRDLIEQYVARSDEAGLSYPYDGLVVVEVPSRLRSYGGSLMLDTAFDLPGILPYKESVAVLSFGHRLGTFASRGNPSQGRRQLLMEFLRSDYHGGDLIRGFSRNLFETVSATEGVGAQGLRLLCRELTYGLVVVPPTFTPLLPLDGFTAHAFDVDSPTGSLVADVMMAVQGRRRMSLFRQVNAQVNSPAAWTRAERSSLLDHETKPAGFVSETSALGAHAMVLKAGRTAAMILEALGREKTGELLSRLRTRFAGAAFGVTEFTAAMAEIDASVARVVNASLTRVELPAFVASEADVATLATNNGTGKDGYYVRVNVRNDAPVAGAAYVSTDRRVVVPDHSTRSDLFVIDPQSSIEIGFTTLIEPRHLWLHSFLSLNRDPVLIYWTDRGLADPGPFTGTRPSKWKPRESVGLIVDDLDTGFSTESDGRIGLRGRFDPFAASHDHGLPMYRISEGEWFRLAVPGAWGRYRRTLARLDAGDTGHRAFFAADIPFSGNWQLNYHMPNTLKGDARDVTLLADSARGQYRMNLRASNYDEEIEFDGRATEGGWNKVGVYMLDPGLTVLAVGSAGKDGTLVADAIQWIPVDHAAN